MELSLTFDPDAGRGGHADLTLRFGDETAVCDIYFFAIDHHFLPGEEGLPKIHASLRRLFEQWLAAVRRVQVGEVAYLPYDFSDEYTGWLRCTRSPEGFEVIRGWCAVEGWSFSPSDIGDRLHHLDDFRVVGSARSMTADELQAAILASAARLGQHI